MDPAQRLLEQELGATEYVLAPPTVEVGRGSYHGKCNCCYWVCVPADYGRRCTACNTTLAMYTDDQLRRQGVVLEPKMRTEKEQRKEKRDAPRKADKPRPTSFDDLQ